MKKDILIHIKSAFDAAGINATESQFNRVAKAIRNANDEAAKKSALSWTEFLSKFKVIAGAVRAAWSAVKFALNESFRFEEQARQFKFLIGSIDEAKTHMADLKALGDTPPFSVDQFAAASRSLMVMSDGVLGYKKSLELVGDAAAATGVPIEQMGHAIGRLYALIRDGQPVSRAVMELRNMGAITPEVCAELDKMQKAGSTNAEIWAVVEKSLGRFNGAMAETEKTGKGLMSAISSRWTNLVRQFGDAFLETAEGGMAQALDAMKQLEEDGSIAEWAEETVGWLQKVYEGFAVVAKPVGAVLGGVWKAIKVQYEAIGQGVGGIVGTLAGGGGIGDALKAGANGVKNAINDVYDLDGREAEAKAERVEKRRAQREQQRKADEVKSAEREAAEKKRMQDQLAESQKRIDAERAAKAAEEEKKKIEEAKKIADAELRARQKAEDEIHRRRVEHLKELASTQGANADKFVSDFQAGGAGVAAERKRIEDVDKMKKIADSFKWAGTTRNLVNALNAGDTEAYQRELEWNRKYRGRSFNPNVEAAIRGVAEMRATNTTEDLLRQVANGVEGLRGDVKDLLSMK